MENKNSCPAEKINELQSISNLTTDKSIAQTSSTSSEFVNIGLTSDSSYTTDLKNKSKLKDESKDSCASEAFENATGNENSSFQNSHSFHTDAIKDQSTSDIVSVSSKSTDLMMTSAEEESAAGHTEQLSLKDASYPQTSRRAPKMIAEKPMKAENLPNFCADVQKDIAYVHKVLSPFGEDLAASFLTSTVVLSPGTSPETSPRTVVQSKQSTNVNDPKDGILIDKYETDEASDRYKKNLRKFLKDIEPRNRVDKGNMTGLMECEPNEQATSTISIKSETGSNVKACTSSKILENEVIPSSSAATEACTSEVSSLESKQVDFCSPKAVLDVFKVPESPKLSGKRLKSPKLLISPIHSKDMEQNSQTPDFKKPRRPTSLHLSPRTSFYDFCPGAAKGILRLSRSLPNMSELQRKDDRPSSMNTEDLKNHKCVKALFTENVKLGSVSPKSLILPSNTEQAKKQLSFAQPDILDGTEKETSQEQLSVKTQSLLPRESPSWDRMKARKKLTFTLDPYTNTEDSEAMEVDSQDHLRSISKLEGESSYSQGQLSDGSKSRMADILPSAANVEGKNVLVSDSNISESPSLQGSTLSTTDVKSNILKSETDEETKEESTIAGIPAFETSPRKRKSRSPESNFSSSSIPKKTKLMPK